MDNEMKYAALDVKYEIDDSFDSDRFIKMRLRVCHDGVNRNGSHFTVDNIKDAEKSIANTPILAHVVFDDDNQPQFGGHDMTIEKTSNGEYKKVFKEVPIGVIPENCNPDIQEYNGKQYAYFDAYIWKGYSNYAEDVILRDETIKLSMEISVDDFSFDVEHNIYNVNKFRYKGITFLGNDMTTGMIDAEATIVFSESEKQQMIDIMTELQNVLNDYSALGGGNMNDEVMQKKQEVTPEPVVSDMSLTFTISHEDIKYGLYNLFECGSIWIDAVYDKYFDYYDMDGKLYRQSYNEVDGVLSLVDDKTEMFVEKLTASEKERVDTERANQTAQINSMQAELDELRGYKANIETEKHNAEIGVVIDKWASLLTGNEEFEAVKAGDYSTYTVDDIETKCKCIFADTKADFSAKAPVKESLVHFSVSDNTPDKKTSPYGNLFEMYGK